MGKKKQKEKKFSETDSAEFEAKLRCDGLTIKTIIGDGNCLFRSLADQLGSRNHMQIRLQVVDYIKKNRDDFEPFIEDDITFDDHVSSLSENGTYGGNDSIVAFSRLHNCTVYIHQFNTPAFVVQSNKGSKEIHLSYHNGDHYNSVIKLQPNVNNQVKNQENGATSSEKNNNNGNKRGVNKSNSNANRKQKNNNINSNQSTGTINKKSPIDNPHIENLKIDETTSCSKNIRDQNSEKENISTGTSTTTSSTKQKPLSRRQKLEQKKKDRKQESLQRKRDTFDENSNGFRDSLFNASNVKTLSI